MSRPEGQKARSGSSPVERPRQRIPVYVVLPPRLLLLDIAGPLEVLRRANHVQSDTYFDVHYIGPSPSLRTSISLTVSGIQPLPDLLPESAWIVLAGDVEEIMCGAPHVVAGAIHNCLRRSKVAITCIRPYIASRTR